MVRVYSVYALTRSHRKNRTTTIPVYMHTQHKRLFNDTARALKAAPFIGNSALFKENTIDLGASGATGQGPDLVRGILLHIIGSLNELMGWRNDERIKNQQLYTVFIY